MYDLKTRLTRGRSAVDNLPTPGQLAESLLEHLVFIGCDIAGFSASAKKADQWRDVTSAGGSGSVIVPYQFANVGGNAETAFVSPTLGYGSQRWIKQHIGRFGHVATVVDMRNMRNIYHASLATAISAPRHAGTTAHLDRRSIRCLQRAGSLEMVAA